MHIPRVFKIDTFAEDDAATIHKLRSTLPTKELREEERQAHTALVMYQGALRVADAQFAVIRVFYLAFWYNRAVDRYVNRFLPLIVNQENQAC